jgi:hypothetical protein
MGSNVVKPLSAQELKEQDLSHGSPDKKSRVGEIFKSHGMKQTLVYNDNDISAGLVNTKP